MLYEFLEDEIEVCKVWPYHHVDFGARFGGGRSVGGKEV